MRQNLSNTLLGTFLLASTISAPKIFACASCGSGGDDPLILYPNEQNKFYLGFAHASSLTNIGAEGETLDSVGPESRSTATFAIGHSFTPRFFTTLTAPLIRNEREGEAKSNWGDPLVAARYTALMQNLANPALPQIQTLLAYKHSSARSIRETQEPSTMMDVYGNGFSEARVGIDLWHGQYALKGGVAHTVSYSFAEEFRDLRYQPGLTHRSNATVAYSWLQIFRSSLGVTRESRGALKIDGTESEDSAVLQHGIFAGQDAQIDAKKTLRLVASRQAGFGVNRNALRSDTVTLAWMQTL